MLFFDLFHLVEKIGVYLYTVFYKFIMPRARHV